MAAARVRISCSLIFVQVLRHTSENVRPPRCIADSKRRLEEVMVPFHLARQKPQDPRSGNGPRFLLERHIQCKCGTDCNSSPMVRSPWHAAKLVLTTLYY